MTRAKPDETAVLIASDVHYGATSQTYGADVCRERWTRLGTKLDSIHGILTGAYKLNDLVVFFLGDAVDGDGIYPGQPHYQDISDPVKQANQLAHFLADWTRERRKVWKSVTWECVPGNHGRVGRFARESASFDLSCYQHMADRMPKGARVLTPEDDATNADVFIRIVDVRGHRFLLYHGHDIPMYMKKPYYSITERVKSWAVTRSLAGFGIATMGHFHQLGRDSANDIDILTTGTMKTNDSWALRRLGAESPARWWFFGVNDDYPITWSFALDLA